MAPESLPKTCRRGRPRSWPSRPEWTVRKGRQRASSEASHLGISTTLTVGLSGIPRSSHQFHTGTGYSNSFQTRKVQQSRGNGKHECGFLSLSLSDSPSHSHPLGCELPPSQARCASFYSRSFALSHSLMLSLPLPASCLCSSVITFFLSKRRRSGFPSFSPTNSPFVSPFFFHPIHLIHAPFHDHPPTLLPVSQKVGQAN